MKLSILNPKDVLRIDEAAREILIHTGVVIPQEQMLDSFRKAGEYYNLKCPLTGEAKEGKNWMETH